MIDKLGVTDGTWRMPLGFEGQRCAPTRVYPAVDLAAVRVDSALESWLWSLLGLTFLPITTLVSVLVAPNGVTGWEWAWLAGALVADLGLTGSSVYTNRGRAGMV